jgi:translation initiation factor 1
VSDSDLGSIAGLPDDLGIDDDLARSQQRVSIRVDTRRYGKPVTVVSGFGPSVTDLDDLASALKSRLAVGGTVNDDRIELQGDHEAALPEILRKEGFDVAG